ncbi:MAG: histidine kinase [Gemmatimonadota bacterium]
MPELTPAIDSPSDRGTRPFSRPARWITGLAIWTVLALLSTSQSAIYAASSGQHVHWTPLILVRLADWYTCAIFTPAYFWLVRRYPIDRVSWPRTLPAYLLLTCIFVVIKYAILTPIMGTLVPGQHETLGRVLAGAFIFESFAFWCILGVVHAVVFYERYRDREVQASELRARLSAAQLDALTGQLQPHFLFNTLQGVSTLMHRDPHAADLMLARLSELLRRTLTRGVRQEVLLREEMDLLSQYVGIMQVRLGDRLVFVREIDPLVENALVPHFILQPLVENALEHGITRRAGPGRVVVQAARKDQTLTLTVIDDGPGPNGIATTPRVDGIGLGNTRLRLQQLYGNQQQLTLTPISGGGMQALLEIPYHPGADGPSADGRSRA